MGNETAAFLRANGIEAVTLHWPTESASPNTLEYLSQRQIDLVINIPKDTGEWELTNGIPLITNIQLAQRFVEALSKVRMAELQIKSWQEYGAPERQASRMPRLPAGRVQTGGLTA